MKRQATKDRSAHVFKCAVKLMERHGYTRVSRSAIAESAECSPALVNVYFGTMGKLRAEVLRHAVRESNLTLLAQGIVARHRVALAAPAALKARAIQSLSD